MVIDKGSLANNPDFGKGLAGIWYETATRMVSDTPVLPQVMPPLIDCLQVQLGSAFLPWSCFTALFRTLMMRPECLLLDAPFGAIDPGMRAKIHARCAALGYSVCGKRQHRRRRSGHNGGFPGPCLRAGKGCDRDHAVPCAANASNSRATASAPGSICPISVSALT